MNQSHKVIKNSVWLIIQPLILNIISIAVVGYTARVLGEIDYGIFVFTFAFVTLFTPLVNMGLRTIMVRDLAKNKDIAADYVGKMAVLRVVLSLLTVLLIIIVVNIMQYQIVTKQVVYIASLIIVLQTLTTTFTDVFQAFENMRYVAQVQFISGFALTLLTVVALYAGYGLFGVMVVYCIGNLLGLIISVRYMYRDYCIPRFSIDMAFWRENLVKGAPFFFPMLMAIVGIKIGIIFLSKMSGEASVAAYGAANNLVEKLIIIPDGICTAIFPTLVALYQHSRQDACALYRKFYAYLLMLGLPLAIGTTILAKPIIFLIYGKNYASSVLILQILMWWLFFVFLTQIQGWTLGAVEKEKIRGNVLYISTVIYLVLNILLIPHLKEVGAALANLFSIIISFIMFSIVVKRSFLITGVMELKNIIKFCVANTIMAIVVLLLKDQVLFISIPAGMAIYAYMLFSLKIVLPSDFSKLLSMFASKKNEALV